MGLKNYHLVSGAAAVMAALLLAGAPVIAQEPSPEPGICDGAICGPSGAFTAVSFPTLTEIAWSAFPANPPRPYSPAGRALYVAADGDDSNAGTADAPFATLTHAVEVAQSGDVVWVADGEYRIGGADYYEGLVLETPGVTLAAQNVGGVTLVPADPYTQVGIEALADDLVIDGFVIQGFASVGIEFGRTVSPPQRNLALKHLRVEQVEEGIRAAYGGGGQPVTDGLLVYDVWLRDITGIAMQCGEGPCNNMRWEALRVEMPTGDIGNSSLDGLAVEYGDNVVVFNAEVSGASADGIDLKSTHSAVANVIVHDLGRNGIKLWQGGDVINALVYNTGADAALVFESGAPYRVLNTIVARHSWGESAYGMTVAYDSPNEPGRLEIVNSVFYQNSGAIWVSPEFQLDVQNSVFFGSANGQELIWGDVVIGEDESTVSALESAGGGAHNLGFVDPGFANPSARDYTWNPDSPLFDAGTDAGGILPDFDLYGHPRVVGAAVDVSPWEVQPAP
jgi:hypothetical protein